MKRVMRLTEHGGQYRITLPRDLLKEAGLLNAKVLTLEWFVPHTIVIEEYYGKGKEKRDIPEDQT